MRQTWPSVTKTWDAAPRQVTVEADESPPRWRKSPPKVYHSPAPRGAAAKAAGGTYSNWMIWLENNALWAGCLLIAAVIGCMLIWRRHRKD